MLKVQLYLDSQALGTQARRKTERVLPDNSSVREKEQDSPPVIVDIPKKVYAAVDDFICLQDSDSIENFKNLSAPEKNKFIQIVGALLKNGTITRNKLEIDGIQDGDIIKKLVDKGSRSPLYYDNADGMQPAFQ